MSKKKLQAGLDNLISSTAKSDSEQAKPEKRTLNLWIDVDLHQKLKIKSIMIKTTMTNYLIDLIKKDLGE